MNEKLTSLINRLVAQKIPHRVVDLGGEAVRTRDVLDRVDVDADAIVKTIMFKGKKSGVFSVSVFGTDRVSYPKLRAVLNDKISTLRPQEMRELGWEPGECCPLSVPGPLFIDPTVFEKEIINTGSGDLRYGLEFPSKAITQMRGDVTVVDVHSKEP